MAAITLRKDQHARIRKLLAAGVANVDVARIFNVSRPNIAYHRAMLERGTRKRKELQSLREGAIESDHDDRAT